MHPESAVEIADRYSRKRAVGVAAAAAIFLAIQAIARPVFVGGPDSARHVSAGMWALNAAVLLALLATGGGLANRSQIRVLVNDEVSRSHYTRSVVAGFWVAMTTAMGLYLLSSFQSVTGREAVYLIVTVSIVVALFVFSFLEHRAHRDA